MAQMVVRGQPHTPATLPPIKESLLEFEPKFIQSHSLVKCTDCTTPAAFKKQYKNYCGKPEFHSGHIISLFTIKVSVICDVMPCT